MGGAEIPCRTGKYGKKSDWGSKSSKFIANRSMYSVAYQLFPDAASREKFSLLGMPAGK
jgi:hypothetical protein